MKKWFFIAVALFVIVCATSYAQRCPLPIPGFLDEIREENAKAEGTSSTKVIRLVQVDFENTGHLPRTLERDMRRAAFKANGDHGEAPGSYRNMLITEAAERVRYAAQEHGYYKAMIGDPRVFVVRDTQTETNIRLLFPVELGERYTLADIRFRKNTAFSNEQLRAAFHIRTGELFNVERVRLGLDELRRMYGEKGYINFTPVPDTQLYDATATIILQIDIEEGKQFHIGEVRILGSDPAIERLLAERGLKTGALYNSKAFETFVIDTNAAHLRSPGLDGSHDIEFPQNNATATLDIIIDVRRCPEDPEECGGPAPCPKSD